MGKCCCEKNKNMFNIVDENTLNFTLDLMYIGGDIEGEEYEGSYVVTPKTTEQQLETKNKLLTENVRILKIPYIEISNAYGTTVNIAEE